MDRVYTIYEFHPPLTYTAGASFTDPLEAEVAVGDIARRYPHRRFMLVPDDQLASPGAASSHLRAKASS